MDSEAEFQRFIGPEALFSRSLQGSDIRDTSLDVDLEESLPSTLAVRESNLSPNLASVYIIDAETRGTTQFRNPRAQGCGVPSVARALLRARGFL